MLFVLSFSLSLCNLEHRKRYWSHGMCQHTPAEQHLRRASTEDVEAPGSRGRRWSGWWRSMLPQGEKTPQGPVALAQSADIHINTIKLPCLFCSQAFLLSCLLQCSPRLLHEYQFSVDCSPDVKRSTASCAYGRLAGIAAVQALHEVTAEGLQNFSSSSARWTWQSSEPAGLLWSCHTQDPGLICS